MSTKNSVLDRSKHICDGFVHPEVNGLGNDMMPNIKLLNLGNRGHCNNVLVGKTMSSKHAKPLPTRQYRCFAKPGQMRLSFFLRPTLRIGSRIELNAIGPNPLCSLDLLALGIDKQAE